MSCNKIGSRTGQRQQKENIALFVQENLLFFTNQARHFAIINDFISADRLGWPDPLYTEHFAEQTRPVVQMVNVKI